MRRSGKCIFVPPTNKHKNGTTPSEALNGKTFAFSMIDPRRTNQADLHLTPL